MQKRRDLAPECFALPQKRKIPIHDANHVKMAWLAASTVKGLSDEERRQARVTIAAKAKEFELDVSEWTQIGTLIVEPINLSCMSLEIPQDDHPNKMPFSGIMTRIGTPSDGCPHGSGNRKVVLSKEAAEKALGSLLGMAVNMSKNCDDHTPQNKIGIITEATIEGDAINIAGFIYAADFPNESTWIKANQDALGFSFEASPCFCEDATASVLLVTELTFTGAAILLKNKAAYTSTSLAASAASELEMTKEEMAEMLAAANKPMHDGLTKLNERLDKIEAAQAEKPAAELKAAGLLDVVEPHAVALASCADALEAAGIGMDPANGHVAVIRRMVGDLRASAALGQLPTSVPWLYAKGDAAKIEASTVANAEVEALKTEIADLKAQSFKEAAPPERKTISGNVKALLARHGLDSAIYGDDNVNRLKLTDALANAKSLSPEERIKIKRAAGI